MGLILASASPRRRQILESAGIEFSTASADLDEEELIIRFANTGREGAGILSLPPSIPAEAVALMLSREKAQAVFKLQPDNESVLAADTVVVCDGLIFGKPENSKNAAEMLQRLSGRTHHVITAHTLIRGRDDSGNIDLVEKAIVTEVTFRRLTAEEIERYAATDEPLDKAGAYAIQGAGASLVASIHGDYLNVIGLSLNTVMHWLSEPERSFEPDRLFVYGTLMTGMSAHNLLKGQSRFIASGTISGRLYNLGSYPAASNVMTSERISGELFAIEDPGLWHDLDRYEECNSGQSDSYSRRMVPVVLDNGAVTAAYAYFAESLPAHAVPVEGGNYRQAGF